MAVTLQPDDFIQPKGELDPAFFPDSNCTEYVTGWLAKATELIDNNAAVMDGNTAALAYVYARGFSYLAMRYNSLATTTTISGKITRTIQSDQVKIFQEAADTWQSEYNIWESGQDPENVVVKSAVAGPVSHQMPVVAVW